MTANRVYRFLFLGAILALLPLAGCNTLDPQVVQTQTRGKSIAVSSELGPNLELNWIGTTIFSNRFGHVPVPGWSIDELAANTARAALQSTQRYPAIAVFPGIHKIGDATPKLPAGTQADFLLLFRRFNAGDPIYNTNQSFEGLGIAQRTFFGFQPPTRAHVGVTGELFDLAADKSLGSISDFSHWEIAAKLTSDGTSGSIWEKQPAPIIAEKDLDDLKSQFSTKLITVIEKLVREMGLQ